MAAAAANSDIVLEPGSAILGPGSFLGAGTALGAEASTASVYSDTK